jgi:Cu(I)/Ag(I) efflux system membrane protein CusA/SilA
MLATGIKSPLGIKVSGNDLGQIEQVAGEIERAVKDVPGVSTALAERVQGGRYIDISIDRNAASRYGMSIADVQSVVSSAIGGENIGETIEGRRRFPINVRYPRESRDSVEGSRPYPSSPRRGAQIPLSAVAAISPRRRAANAALGERPPVGVDLCRYPWARSRFRRPAMPQRVVRNG